MGLKRRHYMIGVSFFLLLAGFAYAAQAKHAKSNYTLHRYNDLVKNILIKRNHQSYDFYELRELYSRMVFYDPDGKPVIEELRALAPVIKPESDDRADIKNFDRFKILVMQHLGNLNVVDTAIDIARAHPGLMSQTQLSYIYKGMISSLTLGGNGLDVNTAYRLYTLGEEGALLNELGGRVVFSSVTVRGKRSYAVYKIEDHDDEGRIIYAHITRTMDALERREREAEKEVERKRLLMR